MRHIKNFFHDINDILLAVIIVVVAVGVIYWRMQIILDYPKQLANEQVTYEQEDPNAEILYKSSEDTGSEEDKSGGEAQGSSEKASADEGKADADQDTDAGGGAEQD